MVLNYSKKAIFAIHRKDQQASEYNIRESEKIIEKINKKFSPNKAKDEGAFMAALEEYVEAKLFSSFKKTEKIKAIKEFDIPVESYIGGLCDLSGELIRMAINEATEKNFEEVEKTKKAINEILNELIDFDITGPLRTKYDQAKRNLNKIEQINYEIKLR
jgi:predicted translin family RNA/ssDNA-binding protein